MSPKLFECRDCGGFHGYRSRPKNFTEKFLVALDVSSPGALRRLFPAFVSIVIPSGAPKTGNQKGTRRDRLSVA